MSLISRLIYRWHLVSKNYNQMLLDGCLDYGLKHKIMKKVIYHETKIKQLNSF